MELVVALDMPQISDTLQLLEKIGPRTVKIGSIGMSTYGLDIVHRVQDMGCDTIIDTKLYDIPNTMAETAKIYAEAGVKMFTVHASAGEQALMETKRALSGKDTKMLAVTTLTSYTVEHCKQVYSRIPESNTQNLVKLAYSAGADGVVCNIKDAPLIDIWSSMDWQNRAPREALIKFVPGIRFNNQIDDHQKVGNIKDAVAAGADYIVIGRPIYKSEDPKAIVEKIVSKISRMEAALEEFENEGDWDYEPREESIPADTGEADATPEHDNQSSELQ